METNAKQQVVERVKSANNVLVTVSNSPSVDQLASAMGMTLLLNKLGKHSTTVFSGEVPSVINFLQPEKTIEKTTDSLRDFIISLDKSKADKLRYKVEDEMVKIFITPYRTSITDADLEFGQGDFNVDVVVALGVLNRDELDQAIMSHGRILHDATVISMMAGGQASNLGSINWQDEAASSLSEMLVSISESFGSNLMDTQIATAFLTGIVSETDRFKNEKTTPKVLTMSAQLVAAGANQQLIATELETPPPPPPAPPEPEVVEEPQSPAETPVQEGESQEAQEPQPEPEVPEPPRTEVDVVLPHDSQEPNDTDSHEENHEDSEKLPEGDMLPQPQNSEEHTEEVPPAVDFSMHDDGSHQGPLGVGPIPTIPAVLPPTDENAEHHDEPQPQEPDKAPDLGIIEINHDAGEHPSDQNGSHSDSHAEVSPIHIDEHGNIVDQSGPISASNSEPNQSPAPEPVPQQYPQPVFPPIPEPDDPEPEPEFEQPKVAENNAQTTPSAPPLPAMPDMNLAPSDSLGNAPHHEESQNNQVPQPEQNKVSHGLLPSHPVGSPMGPAMSGAMEDATSEPADATDILNLPPLDGRQPEVTAPAPTTVSPVHEATIQPPSGTPGTEHKAESLDDARNAVMSAIGTAPYNEAQPEPLHGLGSTPLPSPQSAPPLPSGVQTMAPPPNIVTPNPSTPPPGPPPMMPPIITNHRS